MEVICSSETSIAFNRTLWYHIPEDTTLHGYWRENLKSKFLIGFEVCLKSTEVSEEHVATFFRVEE
jgi:hypothetical protein